MVVYTVNKVAYSLQLPMVNETGSTTSCQHNANLLPQKQLRVKWRILVTYNKDKNDELIVYAWSYNLQVAVYRRLATGL